LHADTGDELAPGTALLRGQYTIDEYLNSGGFGITYRARDSLGRPVVIKECFPGVMCLRKGTKVAARSAEYTDELAGMIEGFVSEAHNLAALTHKNIVHVHQVFEENDTAYMAIDYIDGMDLLERIDFDSERMTAREILRLTKRILPAVRYIHSMGMLHRDISPDNILIDQTGEPILIDFGAARKTVQGSKRAISQMKFVKDGYSPQEFYIAGADQGPWSDIYSLAASLYHAISGEAPEDGQKRMSALAQKQPDPYVPLAKRIHGYPPRFLETIDTALKINPKDRIQTAEEWMRRLANRPAKSETKVKKIDVQASVPAPAPAHGKVKKHETLPDLREISVRREMLSAESDAKRGKPVALIGGLAVAVLASAGISGYLMTQGTVAQELVIDQETSAVVAEAVPTAPDATPALIEPTFPTFPTESAIASDTAARTANVEWTAGVASPVLLQSEQSAPLPRPENLVTAARPPQISFPTVSAASFSFVFAIADTNFTTMQRDSTPTVVEGITVLFRASAEPSPSIDTRLPPTPWPSSTR